MSTGLPIKSKRNERLRFLFDLGPKKKILVQNLEGRESNKTTKVWKSKDTTEVRETQCLTRVPSAGSRTCGTPCNANQEKEVRGVSCSLAAALLLLRATRAMCPVLRGGRMLVCPSRWWTRSTFFVCLCVCVCARTNRAIYAWHRSGRVHSPPMCPLMSLS
jgi:hypothetical protein